MLTHPKWPFNDLPAKTRMNWMRTPGPLREAWTSRIRAEDYDAHMASVGQAQANAELVAAEIGGTPPAPDTRLLFAGAGTGQMFNYIPADLFAPYRVTFTDVNPSFLDELKRRLEKARRLRFETRVDDLEDSKLGTGFDMAVAVLVLEHVDWRKGVATLCRLAASRVFIILQENPPVVPARPLIGSMAVLKTIRHELLNRAEVENEFQINGFALRHTTHREVLDGKKMAAMRFERVT